MNKGKIIFFELDMYVKVADLRFVLKDVDTFL